MYFNSGPIKVRYKKNQIIPRGWKNIYLSPPPLHLRIIKDNNIQTPASFFGGGGGWIFCMAFKFVLGRVGGR